jgi:hypothetical protein
VTRTLFPAVATILAAGLISTWTIEAHKGVTSRFTFNAEVYPVFLNRCGGCHVDGGVAPMSLLKYEDAFPWAESIRTELIEADSGDPHDFVKAAHRDLDARDLDIILDWATGGTPEGDKEKSPAAIAFKNEWTKKPALELQVAEPFHMAADVMDAAKEFTITPSLSEPKDLAALDVLPGNPAIVRQVVVSIRPADGQMQTIGTWTPRQLPAPIALKPAVRLAPGTDLVMRIHYKKTWKFEGQALSDQSTIGLFFAN